MDEKLKESEKELGMLRTAKEKLQKTEQRLEGRLRANSGNYLSYKHIYVFFVDIKTR